MPLNKHNVFQHLSELLKPERQPMQTRTELFDSSDVLTKMEKTILSMAVRNFFDFGKHITDSDRVNLINASRKIGLVKLAEQMKNDLTL
jgi:hypothetical protein